MIAVKSFLKGEVGESRTMDGSGVFIEEVDAQEAHVGRVSLKVIDAQLREVRFIRKLVFALSGLLHKTVRQNLDNLRTAV
jgi:hypothetical protein